MERDESNEVLVRCRRCRGLFGTYRVEIVRGDDGVAFVMAFSDGRPARGPRTGTGVYGESFALRQRFRVICRRCRRNEPIVGANFPTPVGGVLDL